MSMHGVLLGLGVLVQPLTRSVEAVNCTVLTPVEQPSAPALQRSCTFTFPWLGSGSGSSDWMTYVFDRNCTRPGVPAPGSGRLPHPLAEFGTTKSQPAGPTKH